MNKLSLQTLIYQKSFFEGLKCAYVFIPSPIMVGNNPYGGSWDPNQSFCFQIWTKTSWKVESNWNELYIKSVDLRPWWRNRGRPEIILVLTGFWNTSNKIKLSWWTEQNWTNLNWNESNLINFCICSLR